MCVSARDSNKAKRRQDLTHWIGDRIFIALFSIAELYVDRSGEVLARQPLVNLSVVVSSRLNKFPVFSVEQVGLGLHLSGQRRKEGCRAIFQGLHRLISCPIRLDSWPGRAENLANMTSRGGGIARSALNDRRAANPYY